jgi:uncharacterized protein YkwD
MRFLRVVVALIALGLGLAVSPAAAPAALGSRADAMIRMVGQASYAGNGIYNTTGAGQARERRIGATGRGIFYVHVENDGAVAADYRLSGSLHTARFSVRYKVGALDVSDAVKDGRYQINNLAPGAHRTVTIEVQTRHAVPRGASFTARLRSRSMADATVDVTRGTVVRPLYSDDQLTVLSQINASRAQNHLAGLAMNRTLATKAQDWSQHLAAIGHLEHSNLTSGVPAGWEALAENVGYNQNLSAMHQAFLASSGHRANLLGPYNYVGTGVTRSGGRVWVVHVFMRT